jgi:DNA helicase HerA-like ATPase
VSLKDLTRSPQQYQEALTALEALEKLGRAEFDSGSAIVHRVLIIEEAHQFVPEAAMLGFNAPGRDESFKFGLLMMQVRKFGVTVVLVSQRTAVVAKSALSQCENIVAFKSVDQTGLDYLGAMGGPSATHLLPRLRIGEAVLMGPAMSTQSAVGVRLKDTSSPGPSLAAGAPMPPQTPPAGTAPSGETAPNPAPVPPF